MQLAEFGFESITLMDGERIESTLELGDEEDDGAAHEVILLTNRRVMHLNRDPKNIRAAFVSIRDVEIVEVRLEREGVGTFIRAGLAFCVAVMLWRVIDHPLGSAAAGLVVAAVGICLIADRMGRPWAR